MEEILIEFRVIIMRTCSKINFENDDLGKRLILKMFFSMFWLIYVLKYLNFITDIN